MTARRSIHVLCSAALAAALAGCGQPSTEPDFSQRFGGPQGKADADDPAMPQLVFATIDPGTTSWAPWFKVQVAAQGVLSVGLVYQAVGWNAGATGWRVANGRYSHRDNGRPIYAIDLRLDEGLGMYGYVRYALFAIRDDGETVWNNNGRNDFYYFQNPYGGPVGYYDAKVEDDRVALRVWAANLGMEQVTFEYDLDGHPASVAGEWFEGVDHADGWQANIGPLGDAQELSFTVRVVNGDSTVVADNFGHRFHVGLEPEPTATIRFYDGGYEVSEGQIVPGGMFRVLYERRPACRDCYQGMCSSTIDIGHRFYDDQAYWTKAMSRSYYSEGEGPITSAPIYIPRDAQRLSLWFRHTGGRPTCEAYDSNNGDNYPFSW